MKADIDRVLAICETAGQYRAGPWLFGDFTAADVMFAPVAARFQTYTVAPTADAERYYAMLLSHPLVTEWLAAGFDERDRIAMFELPDRA